VARGDVDVVIGVRSAVFAPLTRLGLIIVDEEHDASYKQGDGFRYHARDLALLRAQMEGAAVVLGSATPALTSYQRVRDGQLTCLELPERVAGRPLPEVKVLNLGDFPALGSSAHRCRRRWTPRWLPASRRYCFSTGVVMRRSSCAANAAPPAAARTVPSP